MMVYQNMSFLGEKRPWSSVCNSFDCNFQALIYCRLTELNQKEYTDWLYRALAGSSLVAAFAWCP